MDVQASGFDLNNSSTAKIAIIGGGRMGQIVLRGLLGASEGAASQLTPRNFVVVNPGQAKRDLIHQAYGVATLPDSSDLPDCDIVILAITPDKLLHIAENIGRHSFASRALVVSLAAGITANELESVLPAGATAVRLMPNTPLAVQRGTLPLVAADHASEKLVQAAVELFSSVSSVYRIEEELMDAATVMSGCTPGFYAILLEALGAAGEKVGLDHDLAKKLARDTMQGVGTYMQSENVSAEQVRQSVSTEGGGTLAAMDTMRSTGFDDIISSGVEAALDRFRSMAD